MRASSLVKLALGSAAFLAGRHLVRQSRRFDLAGRNVLVTGGSRGLGLLLAHEFAGRGARVAICARDGDELERARRQLAERGHDVWIGTCDLTKPEEIADLIGRLTAERGLVDVLVNNAGTITVGPQEEMTLDDYRQAMDVNFWAAVLTTREVVDGMRRRGRGRVVNVSSIGGKVAVPHLLPYSASKFALTGWSQGLRAELMRDGVYVTTAVPGLIRTGSPPNARFKGQHRKEYAWFALGDALPLTSMSARRAASRIVDACVNGEAEVVLSWQAKLAATVNGLFPGATTELSALTNRLLPDAGGIGTASRSGRESESAVTRSPLTALSQAAAVENNQGG
ncbi:MAG TPA: SDR family NAD(P)-dependent oxidoreductase [Humisphaera sp.]